MSTAAMDGTGGAKKGFKGGNAAGKQIDGVRGKQNGSPVDGPNRRQQQPQPKAWQGPNPVTQRAASGTTNGTTEKPLPKLPAQSKHDSGADKHAHDRTLYLLAHCQGLDATLTLRSGEQFAGVFAGGSFDSMSKSKYVLKMVRKTRGAGEAQTNGDAYEEEYIGEGEDHTMAFEVQDTVSLAVDEVVLAGKEVTQNGSTAPSTFRTDTEISSARHPQQQPQRELQRWDDALYADNSGGIEDMSLDAPNGEGTTGWDQFATNERMYGVQSTYDENIYTTAIDRTDPRYRQREAAAARIAREIESGQNNSNSRRHAAEDDDGDEEEKYSGVRREVDSVAGVALPKRKEGAYVPPSHRPITGKPTVPGAPYDPAIISHSRPAPAPAPAPETPSVVEPTPPTTASLPPAGAGALPTISLPATASTTIIQAPDPTPTPATGSTTADPDHMRRAADAFKQFANNEKLKVRQAQEMKKLQKGQEKNVKLNDLKKFAANFRLNSRVPDDLVPILAKDREKQIEIQRKADEAAKEAEVRKVSPKGATPPQPSSSSAAQTPVPTPSTDPRVPSFGQHSARVARGSQQGRGGFTQGQQSPRGSVPNTQIRNGNQPHFGRGTVQPISQQQPPLAEIRVPTGPASAVDRAPMSPGSATRFNINAMEFKPIFGPTAGATPSPPKRKVSTATGASEPVAAQATASFFGKNTKVEDIKDDKDVLDAFDPVERLLSAEYADIEKKVIAANGGVPLPYKTPPTWPGVDGTSYRDTFAKASHSGSPSSMHTPNGGLMPNGGPVGAAGPGAMMMHQLPPHIQQTPQPGQQMPQGMHTPSQRHPQAAYYTPGGQQQGPPHGGFVDPRMHGQQFAPNGSVQNSPRFNQAQMAAGAFGGQMPPQGHMGPQGMAFGMSPSMQARQMAGAMGGPPQGMMMPGQIQVPFGQHSKYPYPQEHQEEVQGPGGVIWVLTKPTVAQQQPQQVPRGFPPGGFGGAGQHMGAPMMVHNPSSGGAYPMNVNAPPMGGGPQQQYSPMPPHAQPHGMQQHSGHGTPGGYAPRPQMMSAQNSHQGFNPQQAQQQHNMMHGGFAPGPGGPHPMHWQQRQTSGSGGGGGGMGFQQQQGGMTPRQAQAMMGQGQRSPGMQGVPGQAGEEVKGG